MTKNGVFFVSVPVRRTIFHYARLWYKILIRTPVNVRKYLVAGKK
jgi:hypothetical protein